MTNINETLKARGNRYGSFTDHSYITQGLKTVIKDGASYHKLDATMLESLDMIFHKIGRIVNGDPRYIDSWHDIIGYAKLVEDNLIHESKIDERLEKIQDELDARFGALDFNDKDFKVEESLFADQESERTYDSGLEVVQRTLIAGYPQTAKAIFEEMIEEFDCSASIIIDDLIILGVHPDLLMCAGIIGDSGAYTR